MSNRPSAPPESLLRKKYGMGAIDWLLLLEHQEGRCPICRRTFTRKRVPCVDHDHRDGLVRGLLCSPCNQLIGFMHEDVTLFEHAASYLRRPPAEDVFDPRPRDPNAPPEVRPL